MKSRPIKALRTFPLRHIETQEEETMTSLFVLLKSFGKYYCLNLGFDAGALKVKL